MAAWQVQEAKQRFSEVLRHVERDGPQVITRHGEAIAMIVSMRLWREREGDGFKELLRAGPVADLPEPARDRTPARTVEL